MLQPWMVKIEIPDCLPNFNSNVAPKYPFKMCWQERIRTQCVATDDPIEVRREIAPLSVRPKNSKSSFLKNYDAST